MCNLVEIIVGEEIFLAPVRNPIDQLFSLKYEAIETMCDVILYTWNLHNLYECNDKLSNDKLMAWLIVDPFDSITLCFLGYSFYSDSKGGLYGKPPNIDLGGYQTKRNGILNTSNPT